VGYDLYLVRTKDWFDEGNRFEEQEWNEIRTKYPVSDWLHFHNGLITAKYPDKDRIVVLVQIARAYSWKVQGDDGEEYGLDGTPIQIEVPPVQGEGLMLFQKVKRVIADYRSRRSIRKSSFVCPFKVGDRVRILHRRGGVVIGVDEKANHGLGSIKVKFPDGVVLRGPFIGHGFEKDEQ